MEPLAPDGQPQDVQVKVPGDRLAEFYEWFGRWLAGSSLPAQQEPAPAGPWEPMADLELASKAWRHFPTRAKAVLSTLIDHPDERYTGAELARMHDIPNGHYGLAGVWAWPGRQLRAIGRPLPFVAEPNPEGGSFYRMSPRLARLFSEARRAQRGDADDTSPTT